MSVQFNVGGKHFERSRTVVNKHPGTVLGRLMSDASLRQPIFIDRNGDVFSLVLDYMRYGNVVLPVTVPKETFLREMDHYGIVYEEGTARRDFFEELPLKVAEHQEPINSLRARAQSLDLLNKMEYLANYCFRQYVQGYKKGLTIFPIFVLFDASYSEHSEVFATAKMLDDPQKFEVLQNCLMKYRLEIQKPKKEDLRVDRVLLRMWT
eukprot:CAMPEP_0172317134 /NCGR_PEP_ID=MMETSP1058-20130122/30620_1 /TAXON_ID=83371 /ORGANISM="Detonula confervacea, Strain CCMP 353" /LENGTH=207 /DNA_ID=CAMNT_0013031615 /DNA_START=29 /DNA_END=652 /DNA_ORIENTATION=+